MTSPSQVRNLTFSGTDGDRVRVRVIPTSGTVNPLTSIRFGAGDVCAPTFADEFTCELTRPASRRCASTRTARGRARS